ncbi:MAG: ABC transporter substrate-binding protein [bacterium]
MKKCVVSICVLFLIALALPLGAQEPSPALRGVDPTKAEVIFWHQHSGPREKILNEMIDEFNKANPWKITVKGEYVGSYNEVYKKMLAALAAKNPPNLVVAYQNQAAAYQVAGGLVDMNIYLYDPKWGIPADDLKDFFKGFLDHDVSSQFKGMRLGFPPNRSVEVLYYNADWLAELGYGGPPKNWEEFREICIKATDKAKGKWGYEVRTDASNFFAQVISRGGDIAKPDGSGYVLNTLEARASMEFMQKLYKDGYATKIAERYGDQTDFGNRKVIFTMGSSSGLPYYSQAVREGASGPFKWSVAAIPYTTPRPVTNIYGASVSIPKTTPKQQLATWLFVKWFSEPKQQARWAIATNYFPVRRSTAQELRDYMEKNPAYKAAFELLENTKSEPPFAGYDEVRDAITASFEAIIDGADVAATLAKLEAEANKIHTKAAP